MQHNPMMLVNFIGCQKKMHFDELILRSTFVHNYYNNLITYKGE